MNKVPEAESDIVNGADNAVQPKVVVVLAVYTPNPSTFTTSDKPVAPGTTTPSLYQIITFDGSGGTTVAVSVVVQNGIRLL